MPIEFVGVHDAFGQSGKPMELIEYYRMGHDAIVEAVDKVASRRRDNTSPVKRAKIRA